MAEPALGLFHQHVVIDRTCGGQDHLAGAVIFSNEIRQIGAGETAHLSLGPRMVRPSACSG
jgi:hypothetical protein